jgi:septum site-determining protein MinC
MSPEVQIKGIREGLLVSVGEGDWLEAEQALYAEIDRQGEFLKGAKLILDVEGHEINAASMGRLRDQLVDQGLSLWGVLSRSALTEQSAQAMGLATRIHAAEPEPEILEDEEVEEASTEIRTDADAIMVKKTLRSGSRIAHAGHVTVIGDVNPGAEIIAGGNVVVWGRLRGLVHAGAEGDESAFVCAMDLAPTQLRIATHIAIPPAERGQPRPEIAFVRDGNVVAEEWIAGT